MPPVSSSPTAPTWCHPSVRHRQDRPGSSKRPSGWCHPSVRLQRPKMVPPVSSQCRQDDATLQPGTSTRHQVVPGPLGWCHPSVYLSVCLQRGRPGSPNQCHPSVRSAVRMVPPFNPARQPGARMCQDGATRRFERVGSGDLWGHAPICEAKTECQGPNMVPPVSSSPVSSSPTGSAGKLETVPVEPTGATPGTVPPVS